MARPLRVVQQDIKDVKATIADIQGLGDAGVEKFALLIALHQQLAELQKQRTLLFQVSLPTNGADDSTDQAGDGDAAAAVAGLMEEGASAEGTPAPAMPPSILTASVEEAAFGDGMAAPATMQAAASNTSAWRRRSRSTSSPPRQLAGTAGLAISDDVLNTAMPLVKDTAAEALAFADSAIASLPKATAKVPAKRGRPRSVRPEAPADTSGAVAPASTPASDAAEPVAQAPDEPAPAAAADDSQPSTKRKRSRSMRPAAAADPAADIASSTAVFSDGVTEPVGAGPEPAIPAVADTTEVEPVVGGSKRGRPKRGGSVRPAQQAEAVSNDAPESPTPAAPMAAVTDDTPVVVPTLAGRRRRGGSVRPAQAAADAAPEPAVELPVVESAPADDMQVVTSVEGVRASAPRATRRSRSVRPSQPPSAVSDDAPAAAVIDSINGDALAAPSLPAPEAAPAAPSSTVLPPISGMAARRGRRGGSVRASQPATISVVAVPAETASSPDDEIGSVHGASRFISVEEPTGTAAAADTEAGTPAPPVVTSSRRARRAGSSRPTPTPTAAADAATAPTKQAPAAESSAAAPAKAPAPAPASNTVTSNLVSMLARRRARSRVVVSANESSLLHRQGNVQYGRLATPMYSGPAALARTLPVRSMSTAACRQAAARQLLRLR